MMGEKKFTGTSVPKGNLQEALDNAIEQARKLGAVVDWRLETVEGESGGVVGKSLSVTISAHKRA